MLDPQTMRIALGGVSLTVVVLFYLGVYRPTRSAFAGWWSVSLLCAGAATSLLLFNGSDLQVLANPASVALSAAGVTCTWFATCSLHRRPRPLWLLALAPAVILVPTVLEDPRDNIWAGNGPLFIYMGAMFGAGAIEVWRAWNARRASRDLDVDGPVVGALLVTAIAATAIAAFYLVRSAVYVVSGPETAVFESVAGTGPTTGILLVGLVAVTFSASAIGWDQRTQDLSQRATYDDLTGLLGRTEFHQRAERALADARKSDRGVLLVVADLDHFKSINDTYGHAAGDRALIAFAATMQTLLRPEEFAGRLGGEEFALVLLDVSDARAFARLNDMSAAFAEHSSTLEFTMPTVSYGIATPGEGDSMAATFERADLALYRAKEQGRDRAVKYTDDAKP